ncbi:hypothetical protein PCCS19_41970 [Paenibacillus sp. CCS19]|uniref:GTPase n=1 Tax=Paenibacillus sp. CCS19 TaxID=3158387 RepID=UPI00256928EE|nr:GTPase [Paenibacillus cellulosilyticus]GMK41141.1 hypothetical protein PCCS19_41970 [Paenibacillus cellulosilyticus]
MRNLNVERINGITKLKYELFPPAVLQAAESIRQLEDGFVSKVIVCNFGMVKAGKSTLFNALSGFDQQPFATGEIRTTVQAQNVDNGRFIWCDTPGIQANEEDTEEALSAYANADLLLFVHNAIDGELVKQEMEGIQLLLDQTGNDSSFWDRFILVLTNAGQKEDAELMRITHSIREQFLKRWSREPAAMFVVDSLTYLRGVGRQQQVLIDNSCIPLLLDHIETRTRQLADQKLSWLEDKRKHRRENFQRLFDQELARRASEAYASDPEADKLLSAMEQCHSIVRTKAKALEDELAALQSNPIARYHAPVEPFGYDYNSSYVYSSEYSAEQAARTQFEKQCWNKFHPSLDTAKGMIKMHYDKLDHYIAEPGMPYYDAVQKAVKGIGDINTAVVEKLQRYAISSYPKISTVFTVENGDGKTADLRLKKADVDYYGDFSRELYEHHGMDWYMRANIDTDYYDDYVGESWLGNAKYKRKYKYSFYDARRELLEQMTTNIKNAEYYIHASYKRAAIDFISQLQARCTERIAAVKNQLDQLAADVKKRINKVEEHNQLADSKLNELRMIAEQIMQRNDDKQ